MIVVSLNPEKEIIEEVTLHPVNRGFNSIIDATVHATRFKITRDPELKTLIDYHAGIVRKCGGKKELEALAMLWPDISGNKMLPSQETGMNTAFVPGQLKL